MSPIMLSLLTNGGHHYWGSVMETKDWNHILLYLDSHLLFNVISQCIMRMGNY